MDGLLQRHCRSTCTIWRDHHYFQIGLFVDRCVVRTRLAIYLSTLLQIDALNKLLEVAFDLWSRSVSYLLEGRKITDRGLSWDISLYRDSRQCANLFTEAHLALGDA